LGLFFINQVSNKVLNSLGIYYFLTRKELKYFGDSMETENMLKDFGLTEYEIKAYTSLLKLGIATAEQISNLGSIPLPRVYDTLVELQRKGFVLISKGRPKKFKPMSPEKALKSLIDIKKKEYDDKIEFLKNDVNKIVKDLNAVKKDEYKEGKEYDIWSIEKRKNMSTILDQQKKLAKKEILICSGDMSWIKEVASIIKQNIKKGVKIRALVHKPETPEWSKNIKMAKKLGINVKIGYKGIMRGHVIDDNVVSIALKQFGDEINAPGPSKTGSDNMQKYELMTSDNPILVKSFKENFEFWWEKL
jgi:sugar-specific transcriptional regulator TrmB